MDAVTKTIPARPDPPPCDAFGQAFRRLRERRGFTAAGLAAATWVNRYYYHQWECKPGYPVNRGKLLRTCDFLKASESDRRRLLQLADERLMERTR